VLSRPRSTIANRRHAWVGALTTDPTPPSPRAQRTIHDPAKGRSMECGYSTANVHDVPLAGQGEGRERTLASGADCIRRTEADKGRGEVIFTVRRSQSALADDALISVSCGASGGRLCGRALKGGRPTPSPPGTPCTPSALYPSGTFSHYQVTLGLRPARCSETCRPGGPSQAGAGGRGSHTGGLAAARTQDFPSKLNQEANCQSP
jgi:hypothetical protein